MRGGFYRCVRHKRGREIVTEKCRKTGKRRFATVEDAVTTARKWIGDALRGKRPPGFGRWDGRYLRAYACRDCGGWHLTHTPIHDGLTVNPFHEVRG